MTILTEKEREQLRKERIEAEQELENIEMGVHNS